MSNTRKLVVSSVFIAFGVVLPMAFHMVGAGGSILLPMHVPVMIAGLFLGARRGLIIGVLTPVLSSSLTGMPPAMPVLPVMMTELAVYGFIGGYLYQGQRLPLWAALIGAMIVGRVAAMLAAFCMVSVFDVNLSPLVYVTGAVIKGLPGIMLQMAIIPIIVKRLNQVFYQVSNSPNCCKLD